MTTANRLNGLIGKYAEQVKFWYGELRRIMPEYFFRSFPQEQIEAILPVLFNLSSLTGIQKIVHGENVILLYLKNAANTPFAASEIMTAYNVRSAVIHEARRPLDVNGTPQTLMIEQYTIAVDDAPQSPRFTLAELAAEGRKRFSEPAEAAWAEVYPRIAWDAVAELTLDRLADRLHAALNIQDRDEPFLQVEVMPTRELRVTYARTNSAPKGIYYRILSILTCLGLGINRVYARQITRQPDVTAFAAMPVTITTIYLQEKRLSPDSAKIRSLLWQLRHLSWCNMDDLLHQELVAARGWSLPDANLLRAAATFLHSQLAYVDRSSYHHPDIWRLMVLHEPLLRQFRELFYAAFQPDRPQHEFSPAAVKRLEHAIGAINTGIESKDRMIKEIFSGLLNWLRNIRKTNFFVEAKTCLAFRLDPAFMDYYRDRYASYREAFAQSERPMGIFFFYRQNCLGFHVRFAEIARGGWRSVIPRPAINQLEKEDTYEFTRDELFREVYVLAHTQHLKNKDIYEGGAKIITLLRRDGDGDWQRQLYQAQRSVSAAFLQLINGGPDGKLVEPRIVDHLGRREIIEIGPDENMHDVMIDWLGRYAEAQHYALGAGLISGKVDRGINHKEYGVTSFGVHQYLLRTLAQLGIDPAKDAFSIKISGGPNGDVAGNEMKLLLAKNNAGDWRYPRLKIVAVTDGPAAACDPDGLDRDELLRLIHAHDLDAFDPAKLTGHGAFIVYRAAQLTTGGKEQHRLVMRKADGLSERRIGGDEFMQRFQHNLCTDADVLLPCGGRPRTIDELNWQDYVPDGKPSMRAIVEGANSFITPEARNRFQDTGILLIKDASANKCGVITSSYEILCGLMLSAAEFKQHKAELVKELMVKLQRSAEREADWLFAQAALRPGTRMSALTDTLSRELNAKNEEIKTYLGAHPEFDPTPAILGHLLPLLRERFADRLDRIPAEYRQAIAAVELASALIYRQSGDLGEQLRTALAAY